MANIRSFFQPKKDIFSAAKSGDIKLMESILAEKPDIDLRDGNGETPLFIAAESGHLNVVEALLRVGAKVDLASTDPHHREFNTKSATPLVIAVIKGHQEIVKKLLAAHANVNTVCSSGYTPLIIAARYNHDKVVKLLLDAGANIHSVAKKGDTALLWLVKHCRVEFVQILLEAGADVDVVARQFDPIENYHFYEVPLSAAGQKAARFRGYDGIIKMLIKANADVELAYSMSSLSEWGRVEIASVINTLEVAKQKRKALVIKSEELRRDPSTYFSVVPYDILKFFVFPMVHDSRDKQNTVEPSSECRMM